MAIAMLGLVFAAIGYTAGMWTLYYCIKCAIRDGIRESGALDRKADTRPTWTRGRDHGPDTMPDMRAD